jgi:hypothetical protein
MSRFSDRLHGAVTRVCALVGEADPVTFACELDDTALVQGLRDVADALKPLELMKAALAAEIDRRSSREYGYSGLAQRTGHRTSTALIQDVTGQSAADARRATSAGHDLVAGSGIDGVPDSRGAAPAGGDAGGSGEAGSPCDAVNGPWFAPLTRALAEGVLSRDQFDAIRRGLGEPPIPKTGAAAGGAADEAGTVGVWREAASVLIDEACDLVLEDLRAAARLARDTLDPAGAAVRSDERYVRRSFRMWVDESGQHFARLTLDDDGAAWVRTVMNAALRPRRGPRFVDPAQRKAQDDAVAADDRSNEQLQYDTLMAVLRTGAQADPIRAFGDRQPGVRIVVTRESVKRDADGALKGVGYFEETGQAVPAGVLDTYLCDAASKTVTVDGAGRPLDVGREQRLYTAKQRIALSIRDGGCLRCGAEPSRCEVHHINHWYEHHGRTDLADGVLLCRNCHMRLHNQRMRIIRKGDEYWLMPPAASGGPPRRLHPRSLLRFQKVGPGPGPVAVRGAVGGPGGGPDAVAVPGGAPVSGPVVPGGVPAAVPVPGAVPVAVAGAVPVRAEDSREVPG